MQGNAVASAWPSDSKRDKASANHNQADNDEGKETGRSKIFAHDVTDGSRRKISGKPVRDAKSLQPIAFTRPLINQADDQVPHGPPP